MHKIAKKTWSNIDDWLRPVSSFSLSAQEQVELINLLDRHIDRLVGYSHAKYKKLPAHLNAITFFHFINKLAEPHGLSHYFSSSWAREFDACVAKAMETVGADDALELFTQAKKRKKRGGSELNKRYHAAHTIFKERVIGYFLKNIQEYFLDGTLNNVTREAFESEQVWFFRLMAEAGCPLRVLCHHDTLLGKEIAAAPKLASLFVPQDPVLRAGFEVEINP